MDDEQVAPVTPQRQFQTRAYQQELLHESLRRNIVIALDTGSGKTHIAVLRMKHEVERDTKKVTQYAYRTFDYPDRSRMFGLSPPRWHWLNNNVK